MANVGIQLSEAQAQRLAQEAERLGVSAEELARAAVNDLLAEPDDDFTRVARDVLERNKELYRRLA